MLRVSFQVAHCSRRQALSSFRTALPIAHTHTRTYALSRFPSRTPGSARARASPRAKPSTFDHETSNTNSNVTEDDNFTRESQPSTEESPIWEASRREPAANPEESLNKLLMNNDFLVVTRQIEMMNVFLGFEQANRYVINNEHGEHLGYIVEEPRGFLASFGRQIFKTHRPFRALILDLDGSPLLWIRRPFSWINSRMFVQRLADPASASATMYDSYGERVDSSKTPEGEPILDTFGECQQIWHPWRRKYDLFLRDKPMRILSTADEPQPEPTADAFSQVAAIDGRFWAWDFELTGAHGEGVGFVSRQFRGLGREIFTDTGAYFVHFGPVQQQVLQSGSEKDNQQQIIMPQSKMSLEERALTLATAVNIDFDYFSRHSEGGGGGLGLFALFAIFE